MNENLHSIENEKIVLQSENCIELEFLIPCDSDFFDGHFPEFKLLPAVAQFELVTRYSKKYFLTKRYAPQIKRIKFSSPIRPDTNVHLKLDFNKEKRSMSFIIYDVEDAEKIYSSGSFVVELEN